MNRNKVITEVGNWSADPMDAPMCMKIIELIEENRPMGRIIMRMLEFAEKGKFK